MKDFFKELFEYSHHYNQKLIEVIQNNPDNISDKALKIFSHILNAHHIWNNRLIGNIPKYGVWQEHAPDEMIFIENQNFEESLRILKTLELNENIDYRNTLGKNFNNSIRDIIFHIINHSTYHRAQIATEFRTSGLEPLMTDFIFYKR